MFGKRPEQMRDQHMHMDQDAFRDMYNEMNMNPEMYPMDPEH